MYIRHPSISNSFKTTKMSISSFQSLTSDQWRSMSSGYSQINPLVARSGENDPNLTVTFYVNQRDNTSFVIALNSSGAESLSLSQDSTNGDQLDLTCTSGKGGQGTIYYSFTESEGWTSLFDVTLSLTNSNSKKGTWTFTKGTTVDEKFKM